MIAPLCSFVVQFGNSVSIFGRVKRFEDVGFIFELQIFLFPKLLFDFDAGLVGHVGELLFKDEAVFGDEEDIAEASTP